MKIVPCFTVPGGLSFGAEVSEIDISRPLDNETFLALNEAFLQHSVLVFRNQDLTAAQQASFSRRFGPLQRAFHSQYNHPDAPDVLILSNIKKDGKNIGLLDAGRMWHTDMSFLENPAYATMLHARIIPKDAEGRSLGDTLFVSTRIGYEELPQSTRDRIDGLLAIHRNAARMRPDDKRTEEQRRQDAEAPDVIHPVVRRHPVTGQCSLYVQEGECVGIVGMGDEESRDLIAQLAHFCVREEYIYRHVWQEGDFVMWDNVSTQHRATYDGAQAEAPPRLLHRTTLVGAPTMPSAATA